MNRETPSEWLPALNAANFPDVPIEAGEAGVFVGRFGHRVLSSVFQPIVSTVDGATVAHSARIRSMLNGQPEPLAEVFELTGPDELMLQLDRSARTLHALNYYPRARATWRLCLRVQARLVETVGRGHGRVFEAILARLGVPTKDVVIELPRHADEDPALYARALLSYRSRGYRVASDCLQAQDPLLTGGYEVIPDIVAIDHHGFPDLNALGSLVRLVRARGATALVQRIERLEHATLAVEAGADLLQGFYFGLPSVRAEEPDVPKALRVRAELSQEGMVR